ncbi:hypothetical protein PHAVU_011G192300 [Phaseolus vulgaris]|uniref:Aminopeptidase N-like N-terminal domain-containing protein n=1 Tax=Phaseolus vulgaris TaxID=3885 RepID=V7AL43_PHAVU|nr:hypothetical protein PHAVU_011G192300g [Phaseolus vulgaris]ESW05588.1 hypothetical protein PHAVU_011G192300g [Phaseolus vulgaris]
MKKGEKSESSGINSTTDLSLGVVIVSFIHLLEHSRFITIQLLHPFLTASYMLCPSVGSVVADVEPMDVVCAEFEAADDRGSSPCWDEPACKSTYLVSVVIGLFDDVEDHTSDGVQVRVCCQVDKANQGEFALDVAVKTIYYYAPPCR